MLSVSLESCEVKENADASENLVDEINDLFEDLGSGSCMSFVVVLVCRLMKQSIIF